MTRTAVAIDRIATLLVGCALLALGLWTILWVSSSGGSSRYTITAPELATATENAWWPWAAASVGALLLGIALRWLSAHRFAPKAKVAVLTGSDTGGALRADFAAVADAAARALERRDAVASAKGRAIVDRGVVTLEFTATAASFDDIGAVASAVDQVCRTAVSMLGDDRVVCRAEVRIGKPGKRATRRVS